MSGRIATVLVVLAAAALAAASGDGFATGSKTLIALPLVAAVGVALCVLALTRFGVFLIFMLTIRASLNLAKLSGSGAGNTSTNTVASRGLDATTLFAALFLVVAVLWLAARYRASGLPGSRLRAALVVFFLAAMLSVFGSGHYQSSAIEAFRILAVVVMFVVLEQMMYDRQMMNRLLGAIFASAAFPVAYTMIGVLTGTAHHEAKGGFTRITGTFSSSNDFGRYLMVVIISAAAIYPHIEPRLRRWLGLLLACSAVLLLLTLTLTALVGTVVGLFVVGMVQSKRLIAGLAVAGVATLLFVPQVLNRVTSATGVSSSSSASADAQGSLLWRLSYWTQVLPLANSNPVTGIGLDETQYSTDSAKQPHNDYIRAYVETGVIGLAAYLGLLLAMLNLGRRAVRSTCAGTLNRGVAVGFWGIAVAFVLVSAAANLISNVVVLWYVFAMAAAASAVLRRQAT